jgi:V8-like Glu-specific endopeptidase
MNHCTVTHIGGGIAITAGHCLSAKLLRTKGSCDAEIDWGFRKEQTSSQKSRCIAILAMENNEMRDYAVIRVGPVPSVVAEVETGPRSAVGTEIAVFGHANSGPLRWSGACQIDPTAQVDKVGPSFMFHHCDTEPGTSGGPILDLHTGKIVGIHKGGKNDFSGSLVNFGTDVVDTPTLDYLPNRY